MKGISPESQTLDTHIKLVSPTNLSVLIIGESGTGKEVVAKEIHNLSERKEAPFIAVDCGAIPKELATSEFFGHLKGSHHAMPYMHKSSYIIWRAIFSSLSYKQ